MTRQYLQDLRDGYMRLARATGALRSANKEYTRSMRQAWVWRARQANWDLIRYMRGES